MTVFQSIAFSGENQTLMKWQRACTGTVLYQVQSTPKRYTLHSVVRSHIHTLMVASNRWGIRRVSCPRTQRQKEWGIELATNRLRDKLLPPSPKKIKLLWYSCSMAAPDVNCIYLHSNPSWLDRKHQQVCQNC